MLLFISVPNRLTDLFLSENAEAAKILVVTQHLFIINGIGQFFDGLRQTITGALLGQSDNICPAVINITSMCLVGTLSSYLMSFVGEQGVEGIFIGRSISMALAAFLLFFRWFFTKVC